jgi:hypothetical protein
MHWKVILTHGDGRLVVWDGLLRRSAKSPRPAQSVSHTGRKKLTQEHRSGMSVPEN